MVWFTLAGSARAADKLTIRTDEGKLHGKLSADGQVRIFLGIPYAAPPVGPLRWKPPQPPPKWSGTRTATEFGSRCIQQSPYEDMRFRDPGESEDCLTLNIWTPARNRGAKLPVMVWIYGGGFVAGATSEPRQDGEHLAHKGVVVVSMNYRLGILGFLVLPALAAESPEHAAGNYGLLDQLAALQWVGRNIQRFGGDPDRVTIFGESAGSESVSAQMASPLAQGLFARAIGESGAAFNNDKVMLKPLAEREQQDAAFVSAVFGTNDLASLRGLSAESLMEGARKNIPGIPAHFGADVDGWFLPESVADLFREGKQAHIPLLAGWNRDEPSALAVYTRTAHSEVTPSGVQQDAAAARSALQPPTIASFRETAESNFGSRTDEFLKLYPDGTDAEALRSAIDFNGDEFIAFATWEWLEAQVATGHAPVYRYHFERPAPADEFHPAGSGAFHSDDIEYVFGTLDSRPRARWSPDDYKLSDLIETYWTNFAKTGNPNGGDAPNWPQYDASDNWQIMHLDVDAHAGPDPWRARYLFLQSAWATPAK
jgi:para-nitrobenzyl esterase